MAQRDNAPQRSPDEWKTGGEPMTESQASFLKRLSEEAGEPFDETLSKADASRRIDELLSRGRGAGGSTRRSSRSASRSRQGEQAVAPRPPQREDAAPSDRMSDAQAAYLKELTEEEGGEYDPDLTKDEATRRIGELLVKRMARGSPTEPSRR